MLCDHVSLAREHYFQTSTQRSAHGRGPLPLRSAGSYEYIRSDSAWRHVYASMRREHFTQIVQGTKV